jgi:hypothetical protein
MTMSPETQPPERRRPTPEDLAGIPVTIEGGEDLTVRPWRRGKAAEAAAEKPHDDGSIKQTPESPA